MAGAVEAHDGGSPRDWYASARPVYEALVTSVCVTLEALVDEAGIDYLSVTGRAKSLESYGEKLIRKSYANPRGDVHDLAGVRVIAYTESDAAAIVDLVKKTFHVHPDKSLDKTDELGVDRTGYRSVHLVCDLGAARGKLPEYKPFQGMLAEVQVRTVLQHAWAEIEHDRNYKFAGVLPPTLQRRLNLAAGTLEMVDREFDAIARAVDIYSDEVAAATAKGELDIALDSKSLYGFLHAKYDRLVDPDASYIDERVLSEMRLFGIETLADIDRLAAEGFVTSVEELKPDLTDAGFVRALMLFVDIEKYFSSAWQGHWSALSSGIWPLLAQRYGGSELEKVLDDYGIATPDDDE